VVAHRGATIRNFRALDAAVDRVEQVLVRLSNVVDGSSFGVSPTMLDEVTERLTGRKAACSSDPGFGRLRWNAPPTFPPGAAEVVALYAGSWKGGTRPRTSGWRACTATCSRTSAA